MTFIKTDGGRKAAGFKGKTDCGIRAVAVATGMSYDDSRKLLKQFSKGPISRGIYKEDMDAALQSIGWRWHSAPKFEGRKARYNDIEGIAILRMAGHYSVVIHGVLYDDVYSGDKMVYGYWSL